MPPQPTKTKAASFVEIGFVPEHALPSGGLRGAVAREVTEAPIRPLLRKLGYTASSGERVGDFLFDNAFKCSNCEGWFCWSDKAEETHPWAEDRGECHWCRWNLERRAA